MRRKRIPKPVPGRLDVASITEAFAHRMMYSVAKDRYTARDFDAYQALAFAVRDRLMERWFRTQDAYYHADAKRVYYLSLEFLTGRALLNNVLNLGALGSYREALARLGYDLEELQEQEWDAGLGNGGLGRLAACLLESAATLSLPFYGYGIRYEYGIFQQHIQDGFQVEAPDNWLRYGNPWEIPRRDALFPVHFHGRTEHARDGDGQLRVRWVDAQSVWAMAYDTPVVGFRTDNVNTLRLWAAKSSREFDLARFNAGEYVRAVEDKNESENISKVLYPPDDQYAGKELRLKQQYFFVSATLQDVLRRFRKKPRRLSELPAKVAIQLNDTHPALAIPELMRLLVDHERLQWDTAWSLTQQVFAYTNHTILAEALERWPAELLGRLLPRHLEIVEEIDRRFRRLVAAAHPADEASPGRMAILDDAGQVHMARLAIVGSHSVNGVARLHTEILKSRTFPAFHALWPGRFNSKTNGITPRRWLLQCNPALARLVTEALGEGWLRDLEELRGLRRLAADPAFRQRWSAVKRANKAALAGWVHRSQGLPLDPDSLFDCHVKRIHEYKRQLLNALRAIALHQAIRDGDWDGVPRTLVFAGKAAPGYAMAKLIIKLVHAVAAAVGRDPRTRGRLRLAFLPNYSVSLAERIFPACELSEQISTAGTEASGTGNMKAGLNGALTIGTLDGANLEIRDEVGEENIFTFGRTASEIEALRASGYDPRAAVRDSPELSRAVAALEDGTLEEGRSGLFQPIVDDLLGADRYFLCADFEPYLGAQRRAAKAYRSPEEWTRMSILNVAGMGRFSSDRTVAEYAAEIWAATPVRVRYGEAGGGLRPPSPPRRPSASAAAAARRGRRPGSGR